MKYFVFNKGSDYSRGYGEHIKTSAEGIVTEPEFYGKAFFFSRILDSAETGTIWHKMTGLIKNEDYAAVRVSFYASDEIVFEKLNIKELIRNEKISLDEKKEKLKPFLQKQGRLSENILLHSVRGRYLWFLLEIYPQTEKPVELGRFMVYFPAKSWIEYLPEIYRKEMGNDSFLDRYLSIFQSLYDDVSDQIHNLANCLEPRTSDLEFLEWMASWLDVEEPYMWTDEQLRFLLEHAMEFYAARGTKKGVELFVELYTGEKPFVVEWQDWEIYKDLPIQKKLLEELYEDDPGSFTVLVREECVPEYKDYQTLLRLLEQIKPVQMEVHLIILQPYIFADGYSYLGVNSTLGQYENAVIGETSRIAFATIADGGEKHEEH